jgi:quinol monooxygenase YgiN
MRPCSSPCSPSAPWPFRLMRSPRSMDLRRATSVFTYTGEILPGQMDNFKQVAAKVIAAVAAQEPGTLMYEWSLRADQKTFVAVELYQSSDAVIAHLKHVGSEFGKDLGQVQKEISLVVHGTPTDQAKQAMAGLNPVYETPIEGFVR